MNVPLCDLRVINITVTLKRFDTWLPAANVISEYMTNFTVAIPSGRLVLVSVYVLHVVYFT